MCEPLRRRYIHTCENVLRKTKKANARAVDVVGSGARTGKYAAELMIPIPTPVGIWNPIEAARLVFSLIVLVKPTPTRTQHQANQSWGR